MTRPAVFFDRDGTLSEEVGYINHLSRIRAISGAPEAVARLNRAGIPVVMATNQAGAARGYFPLRLIEEANREIVSQFASRGAKIDAVYYCPHLPNSVIPQLAVECSCRKPKPGLLLKAADELGLDLRRSFVVGDRYSDVRLGFTVGAAGILVLTGYGRGEWQWFGDSWERKPSLIAENLDEAANYILEKLESDV